MDRLSRRDFLKLLRQVLLALSAALGLGMLARFFSRQEATSRPTEFDLGPASAYPVGSRTILPEVPAVLLHTPEGFTALSLVCTHLGCTLEENQDGFNCPCHGSRFGEDGSLRGGPATRGLDTLRLEQKDDRLLLYTD